MTTLPTPPSTPASTESELPMPIKRDGGLYCGHEGCEAPVETLAEDGYRRTWSLEVDGDGVKAVFGGLEDFSEDGDYTYKLECNNGHDNDVPFDMSTMAWE